MVKNYTNCRSISMHKTRKIVKCINTFILLICYCIFIDYLYPCINNRNCEVKNKSLAFKKYQKINILLILIKYY